MSRGGWKGRVVLAICRRLTSSPFWLSLKPEARSQSLSSLPVGLSDEGGQGYGGEGEGSRSCSLYHSSSAHTHTHTQEESHRHSCRTCKQAHLSPAGSPSHTLYFDGGSLSSVLRSCTASSCSDSSTAACPAGQSGQRSPIYFTNQ